MLGFFVYVANDSTLNLATGAQTPALAGTNGPMNPFSASLGEFRISALSVEL